MTNNNLKNNRQAGQAMLIAVIFFLLISLTVILGIAVPVIKHIQLARSFLQSKQGVILAEAANEDALYRLNNNKVLGSQITLALNGAYATATVTTISSGKEITSVGSSNNFTRSIDSVFSQGVGASFNYGMQTGTGGFVLMGGSKIVGNVYANGNITATDGSTITGTAIAANSAALTSDQSNTSPSTPTYNISFASSSATQDFAQSFQISTSSPVNYVQFYIKKVGAPSDATVKIVDDSGGSPSTNVETSGTLSASSVSTNYGWVSVTFSSNQVLNPGTTYWLVVDNGSVSSSKYYVIGANSGGYANGNAKLGTLGGTWFNTSPSGLDGYFNLYLGGLNATIGGGTYSGAINVGGDAWAHTVSGGSVTGNLYCQSGTNNNKSCNTSRPDPSPTGFPLSDANIQDWKDEASAGGIISGDYHVNYAGATLGPEEITGNLLVDGGGTLTISGTLYVQGTITLTGGGKIQLASTYGSGSGVLLSDSYISLSGGGSVTGSGQTGSYILIISTSNCPVSGSCNGNNAISETGGAGSVILNAQKGTVYLSGGVSANAVTGNTVSAIGGSTITYNSGLADINFTSGPSGSWTVSSWQEIP